MNTYLEDERLADLLTLRAVEGLDAAESAELDRRLAAHPGADRDVLDRVAAAVMLAGRLDAEPLPAALRGRLVEEGQRFVREQAVTRASAESTGAPTVTPLAAARAAREERAAAPAARPDRRGWYAAAAAVLLAIAGWYPRFAGTPADAPVATTPPVPVTPPAPPTPAQARESLLAQAKDRLVQWSWSGTEDPAAAGVSGDVVWDPVTQQGYMRFVGLPANDAARDQYQLWIFDAERDDRFPVDGGVFDVPAGSTEVVVPIDARLAVAKPAAFAVTVEKPGGVVVSSRERIVVLAAPAKA